MIASQKDPRMPPVAAPKLKQCPACGAPLLEGRLQCVGCGLPRSKMADVLLAKKNAKTGGIPSETLLRITKYVVVLAIVIGVIAGVIYHYTKPVAEPWKAYPNDRTALVQKFFELIATDDPTEHDKAYALISATAKDPQANDERGAYRQLFHDMYAYFAGEFGPNWIATLQIQNVGNPGEPMQSIVTVGTDVLHLDIDPQLAPNQNMSTLATMPPEKLNYGVHDIQEFSLDDVGKSMQMGIAKGLLRGYGAQGSINQLEGIAAAGGGAPLHETPFEAKRRLLPIIRTGKDAAINRALYQLWPIRTDPTVQRRLQIILDDPNYPEDYKKIAKEVKDGTASDEELIAAGVNI
jgi:hypothetical protein